MSQYYLNVFFDLLENSPENPIVILDPYDSQQSLSTNIQNFYQQIRWSLTVNNRIEALVNAYYLGYLLKKQASTPDDRKECRKVLTKHYIISCTRVYNLFKILGSQQLYHSQRSSFWMFRKITRPEYCQLLEDARSLMSFVTGVIN